MLSNRSSRNTRLPNIIEVALCHFGRFKIRIPRLLHRVENTKKIPTLFFLGQIQILVAGKNFGCGSSREHAPWALLDYGISAVVSTAIADIFRSNSLKNGLLPIVVDEETYTWLIENPGAAVSIDVAESTLTLPDGHAVKFPIDSFARYCLLEGIDQLEFLQQHDEQITQFEEARSWTP